MYCLAEQYLPLHRTLINCNKLNYFPHHFPSLPNFLYEASNLMHLEVKTFSNHFFKKTKTTNVMYCEHLGKFQIKTLKFHFELNFNNYAIFNNF